MEKIKRNYIAITLLCMSFMLFFVDLRSGIIVNILSVVAFFFTDDITNYIAAVEKKHAEEQKSCKAVENNNNTIFSKQSKEG